MIQVPWVEKTLLLSVILEKLRHFHTYHSDKLLNHSVRFLQWQNQHKETIIHDLRMKNKHLMSSLDDGIDKHSVNLMFLNPIIPERGGKKALYVSCVVKRCNVLLDENIQFRVKNSDLEQEIETLKDKLKLEEKAFGNI